MHKYWAEMHYHSHYCAHVPFMAFIDSDTVIFAENFDIFMQKYGSEFVGKMGCTIMNLMPPIRTKDNRYYVSMKQWPDKHLPQYCSGSLILIHVEVERIVLFFNFTETCEILSPYDFYNN